ncbi:MAG: glycosyltransferase family 39 protein [bacterium]|nr:glycosyltransferase family 39 protein [bacterium]
MKKRFFKETFFKSERVLLGFIFLFTIVNWILLSLVEKIGPPDFYKIYGVAEKLFSGDFKIGIIPPVFPLLIYPLGKLTALFTKPTEAFIIAGRIISLASGLGVLYFSYLFLKKIVGKFAMPGILFFVISPWYLKLLAFPITNMLYLLFVTAAFYAFLNKSSPWWAGLAVAGGVLTRFEGVLLILSGFINYFKFKKRYFYIFLGLIPLLGALFFFFRAFVSRFFAHFTDIILPQKSYLYIFLHPLEFFNVIYGNILFFVPAGYPWLLKMFLLLLAVTCFIYGLYRLFKIEKQLAVAVAVYEILFLVGKGYIDTSRPDIEFRRIFSGLWVFYLVGFIGGYFLLRKIKPHKQLRVITMAGAAVLIVVLCVSLGTGNIAYLPPVLLLVPVLLYPLTGLTIGQKTKYLSIFVLLVFVVQIYSFSFKQSEEYLDSYAQKSAYTTAQWINFGRLKEGSVILSYTNNLMLDYYLEEGRMNTRNIQMVYFTVPMRNTPETRDLFIETFFKELKTNKVDYIVFDHYVVPKLEFLGINDVQRMLNEEKENPRYFRIRQPLFYKGKNVGYVLKPVYTAHAQTNH